MTQVLRKLVVICPREVSEDVIDAFLVASPSLPGFTSFDANGHGHDFKEASLQERVRGHVSRRCIWMVLPETDVEHALAALREATHNPHVAYWLEPVLEMGHVTS